MLEQILPQNFPNSLVVQPHMESNKATRLFWAHLSPVVASGEENPES